MAREEAASAEEALACWAAAGLPQAHAQPAALHWVRCAALRRLVGQVSACGAGAAVVAQAAGGGDDLSLERQEARLGEAARACAAMQQLVYGEEHAATRASRAVLENLSGHLADMYASGD